MNKNDARVRYTRHALKEAFLTLLREKPVNRITVKEVCALAGLNRATFYAHYSDCYALLENIEQELLDAFAHSISNVDSMDVSALVSAIYAMVREHENACRVLIFGGRSSSVLGRMIDLAREMSVGRWRLMLPRASDEELEMLYTHLSNGLMNVVVGGYDKYRQEDVVRFAEKIVRSSLSLFK